MISFGEPKWTLPGKLAPCRKAFKPRVFIVFWGIKIPAGPKKKKKIYLSKEKE